MFLLNPLKFALWLFQFGEGICKILKGMPLTVFFPTVPQGASYLHIYTSSCQNYSCLFDFRFSELLGMIEKLIQLTIKWVSFTWTCHDELIDQAQLSARKQISSTNRKSATCRLKNNLLDLQTFRKCDTSRTGDLRTQIFL
jgi:hypothetical protein